MEKLEDLFTYHGRIGRLKYFINGIVIPLALIFTAIIVNILLSDKEFDPNLDFNSVIGGLLIMVSFFAAASMLLSSTIRRARDTTFSTTLGVVSFFLLQYIGILILLIAPSYEGESKPESSKFGKAIHMFYNAETFFCY